MTICESYLTQLKRFKKYGTVIMHLHYILFFKASQLIVQLLNVPQSQRIVVQQNDVIGW